ncbi:MAG TPA: hypothetical protein VGB99_09195 [Acidobacteriota bacterium]
MAAKVCRVEYFYATIKDRPGEAYQLLSQLAAARVNLLAFSAIPLGPEVTQLALFPEDTHLLMRASERTGTVLTGPHRAFIVFGDDELGAFASIHMRLADAGVNVYASSGVTDARGGYGYVLYVRPEEYEHAAHVLNV